MSLRLVVQRGAGAHQGPDIIEPLLATAPPAIARGRAAIDDAALGARATLQLPYRDIPPGALIEVRDAAQGATWRGLTVGVRHRMAASDDGAAPLITVLELRLV